MLWLDHSDAMPGLSDALKAMMLAHMSWAVPHLSQKPEDPRNVPRTPWHDAPSYPSATQTCHTLLPTQCFVIAAGAAVAAAALFFAPAALSYVGFTSVGPAAGTVAANMMSAAAIANGGAVPAGSVVSGLQSLAMGGTVKQVVTMTAVAMGAVAGAAAAAAGFA